MLHGKKVPKSEQRVLSVHCRTKLAHSCLSCELLHYSIPQSKVSSLIHKYVFILYTAKRELQCSRIIIDQLMTGKPLGVGGTMWLSNLWSPMDTKWSKYQTGKFSHMQSASCDKSKKFWSQKNSSNNRQQKSEDEKRTFDTNCLQNLPSKLRFPLSNSTSRWEKKTLQ